MEREEYFQVAGETENKQGLVFKGSIIFYTPFQCLFNNTHYKAFKSKGIQRLFVEYEGGTRFLNSVQ